MIFVFRGQIQYRSKVPFPGFPLRTVEHVWGGIDSLAMTTAGVMFARIHPSSTDPKGFTRLVNEEYRALWESATGYDPHLTQKVADIDRKIANLRATFERGLDEDELQWTQQRIRELKTERERLSLQNIPTSTPRYIDTAVALSTRKQVDTVMAAGTVAEKKALLRECVETVVLHPDELYVEIRYQLPGMPNNRTTPGLMETEGCVRFGSGGPLVHPARFLMDSLMSHRWKLSTKGRRTDLREASTAVE